jgi:hypothetical protein
VAGTPFLDELVRRLGLDGAVRHGGRATADVRLALATRDGTGRLRTTSAGLPWPR